MKSIKRVALNLSLLLLGTACSYTPQSHTAPGSEVGGVGGITYNHEKLTGKNHLVTVSAQPGLMETETSMSERIYIFANKFASKTCPSGFDFQSNPNAGQPVVPGFAQRTKAYSFSCR